MIVECPYCQAAHSKAERDALPGTSMVCRRCSKTFTLGAPAAAAKPDLTEPQVGRRPSAKIPVTEFHQASTEIMKVPVAAKRAAELGQAAEAKADAAPGAFGGDRTIQASQGDLRKALAAMKAGDETKPGESLLVPAPSAVPAPAPVPPPAAESTPAASVRNDVGAETSVSSVGQIRQMLDRMKSDGRVAAVEEPVAPPASPAAPPFVSEPTPAPASPGEVPLALEQEASVPGTGLFFDEEPPAAKRPAPLAATEPARRVPDKAHGWPAFPLDPLRSWTSDVAAFVMAQEPPLKIGILAGLALALLLLVIGLVFWVMPNKPKTLYVDDVQALMSGPGAETAFTKVGEVQRGEPVWVFERGGFGSWVMVRDYLGRVGYVSSEALSPYRPLARAGVPFVACRTSPIEPSSDGCHARGQAQFDSCRDVCHEESNEAVCLEQCQRQLTSCVLGCEGKPTPAPAPSPSPAGLDGVATDAGVEPGAEPRDEHDRGGGKKPKPSKKPKKPKKK